MSTEILTLLNSLVDLSPTVMLFLVSLAAIVVAGLALIVVIVMTQK